MFAAVTPEYAAAEVIRAIQMNHEECSIPRCLIYLDAINRYLHYCTNKGSGVNF